MTSGIIVKGLTKSYENVKALGSVDLEIKTGEIMVVLGPNGSGKSTLLRIMASALEADSGEVTFNGSGPHDSRAFIGVLFDRSSHWDKLTGMENAMFFASMYGMNDSNALHALGRLFASMDLEEVKDRPVSTYSLGMRRKLALVEALAHQPKFILMDEPTMGLDFTSRMALLSILKEMAEGGSTVVIATNDIAEAEMVADRVCIFHRGRVMGTGTPDELIAGLERSSRIEIHTDRSGDLEGLDIAGSERTFVHEAENELIVTVLVGRGEAPSLYQTLSRTISIISGTGSNIHRIEIKRPDLGDVFLKMTGERVR